MNKPMTPIQIKHALAKAGITQVQIADDCDVSKSFVSQIINNTAKGHSVRCHIAKVINLPVNKVWKIKPNPSKAGPWQKRT